MRRMIGLGTVGVVLLGAMSASPAVSGELNFNEKTTRALMHRCRSESPPMTSRECLQYLQGLADGYCLANSDTVPQAKTCADAKYAEAKASVQSMMAAGKSKQPVP